MRKTYYGEQGWRSGESARLPPMWPGFKSRRQCHMWVEFVVGSLLCSERFFSGYSGFPLFSKTSISKFQFDQELGRRRTDVLPPNHYYLFIYLFIIYSSMGNLYLSSPSISFNDIDTFFNPRYQECRATPLLLPAPTFDFLILTCTYFLNFRPHCSKVRWFCPLIIPPMRGLCNDNGDCYEDVTLKVRNSRCLKLNRALLHLV